MRLVFHVIVALLCATSRGGEVPDIVDLEPVDGVFTLVLNLTYVPALNVTTWTYNGQLPGPTIRIKPGQVFKLRLVNALDGSRTVPCRHGLVRVKEFKKADLSWDHRSVEHFLNHVGIHLCDQDTTNIHFHGLHVSPGGHQDDSMVAVGPLSERYYEVKVPEDHMGGLHIYHPHYHHSTSLHAAGGAWGAIVVEDPKDYLPEFYATMPTKVLRLLHIDRAWMKKIVKMGDHGPWGNVDIVQPGGHVRPNDTHYRVFLVNGEPSAKLTVQAGRWQRLRIIYMSIIMYLRASVEGDAVCDMDLLAKDGIYLQSLPRRVGKIHLYTGGRSDVALRCHCKTSYPCVGTFRSNSSTLADLSATQFGPLMSNDDIFQILVERGSGVTDDDGPEVILPRPRYVADLRNVPDSEVVEGGALAYRGTYQTGFFSSWTPGYVPWVGGPTQERRGITGEGWMSPLTELPVGKIIQMKIDVQHHSVHFHVNPFQIVGYNNWTTFGLNWGDNYFALGDWHDVLMVMAEPTDHVSHHLKDVLMPNYEKFMWVPVRMNLDRFTGPMLVHCHEPWHADHGLIALMSIVGKEGSQTTSPLTCYDGAFQASRETRKLDRDSMRLRGRQAFVVSPSGAE